MSGWFSPTPGVRSSHAPSVPRACVSEGSAPALTSARPRLTPIRPLHYSRASLPPGGPAVTVAGCRCRPARSVPSWASLLTSLPAEKEAQPANGQSLFPIDQPHFFKPPPRPRTETPRGTRTSHSTPLHPLESHTSSRAPRPSHAAPLARGAGRGTGAAPALHCTAASTVHDGARTGTCWCLILAPRQS